MIKDFKSFIFSFFYILILSKNMLFLYDEILKISNKQIQYLRLVFYTMIIKIYNIIKYNDNHLFY